MQLSKNFSLSMILDMSDILYMYEYSPQPEPQNHYENHIVVARGRVATVTPATLAVKRAEDPWKRGREAGGALATCVARQRRRVGYRAGTRRRAASAAAQCSSTDC